jgi:hypothetical protein
MYRTTTYHEISFLQQRRKIKAGKQVQVQASEAQRRSDTASNANSTDQRQAKPSEAARYGKQNQRHTAPAPHEAEVS